MSHQNGRTPGVQAPPPTNQHGGTLHHPPPPSATMQSHSHGLSSSRLPASAMVVTFASSGGVNVSGSQPSTVLDFSGSSNNNSINANVFINNSRSSSTTTATASPARLFYAGGVANLSPPAQSSGPLSIGNSADEITVEVSSISPQVTSSSSSPISNISLNVPRPDHERSTNLYVDTPFPHRPTPRPRPSNPSPVLSQQSSSHLNLRSSSPVARSNSPSSLSSTFTLHNSSSNLLQNQHHSSTLPSVHRTHAKRSFINPNCPAVNSNNNNKTSASNTLSNNNDSNRRKNKLSSSSFSFSSSKNRGVHNVGPIIQTQPGSLSFVKGGPFGGSGGVGGKSFCKSKHIFGGGNNGGFSDISKSVGDLRGSGRRFLNTTDGGGGGLPSGQNFLGSAGVSESIICPHCGRCRCEACTTPKAPPSAWLCSGKFLCSPASAVDCLSCACCVKAALYHCGGDEESSHRPRNSLSLASRRDLSISAAGASSAADDDASSTATKELSHCWQKKSRCAVWACIAFGAIPLPCLLCYFPLTGLRRLLEKGYQRCTSHGCRCPPSSSHHPVPPQSLPFSMTPLSSSGGGSVTTTPLATPPPRPHVPSRPLDTRLLNEPIFASPPLPT